MSLTDIISERAGQISKMNLMDVVNPLPESKEELFNYIKKNAAEYVKEWKPEYESKLKQIVEKVHSKYEQYLQSITDTIDKFATAANVGGDALLYAMPATGMLVKLGTAGLKVINHVWKYLSERGSEGYFGKHPEDVVSVPMLLFTDALAAFKFGSAASSTFGRIVRYRMANEAHNEFLKEIGQYKPEEKLQRSYQTAVLNRADRFRGPQEKDHTTGSGTGIQYAV